MRLSRVAARIAMAGLMSVVTLVNPATGLAHGLAHHHDAGAHAHHGAPSETHGDEHAPAVDAADAGHAALHFSAIAKRQTIGPDMLFPAVPPPPVFAIPAIGRELTEPARGETPVPRPCPTPRGARAPPVG